MTGMTMTTTMMTTTEPSKSLRHEQKHQILPGEDLVLSQRLRKLFPHDDNATKDGTYRVTSLYFDTLYDDALRDKLDGVNRREKFRFRYYGTNTSCIKLEKKFKIHGLCGKHSASLSYEQAQNIIEGKYAFLLATNNPLLMEFYSKLKGYCLAPKTIVRYDREAFRFGPGNVRITLDRNIRTGLSSLDFFRTDSFRLCALDTYTVLEVKYDGFLPELVRMAVQVPDRRAAACSKYALCRRFD